MRESGIGLGGHIQPFRSQGRTFVITSRCRVPVTRADDIPMRNSVPLPGVVLPERRSAVRSRRRTPSRRQSPPSGRFPSAPLSSTLEFLTKTHVVRKIVPRRWAHENVLTGRGHRPFSPAEAPQLGFASALGLDPPFISCIALITELAADLGPLGHYRISARACVSAWLCRGAFEDHSATYYA